MKFSSPAVLACVGAGVLEFRSGERFEVEFGGGKDVFVVFAVNVVDGAVVVGAVGTENRAPRAGSYGINFVRVARVGAGWLLFRPGSVTDESSERPHWFRVDRPSDRCRSLFGVGMCSFRSLLFIMSLLVCGGIVELVVFVNVAQKSR